MTRKQRRLISIGACVGFLAVAAALVLAALRDSIVFFNSPTDVAEKSVSAGTRIRIGGLVKPGSLERGDNLKVTFAGLYMLPLARFMRLGACTFFRVVHLVPMQTHDRHRTGCFGDNVCRNAAEVAAQH